MFLKLLVLSVFILFLLLFFPSTNFYLPPLSILSSRHFYLYLSKKKKKIKLRITSEKNRERNVGIKGNKS